MKGTFYLGLAGTALIVQLHLQGVMTRVEPIDRAVAQLLSIVGFAAG